jgi:hypothetical protein
VDSDYLFANFLQFRVAQAAADRISAVFSWGGLRGLEAGPLLLDAARRLYDDLEQQLCRAQQEKWPSWTGGSSFGTSDCLREGTKAR